MTEQQAGRQSGWLVAPCDRHYVSIMTNPCSSDRNWSVGQSIDIYVVHTFRPGELASLISQNPSQLGRRMMRPTRHVVTASVFLVLTSADSRTTVDSGTNNEAVNISTLHSPLELTAFDGPGHLHSQDSTVAASDFVHRRDEERGLNDVVSHGSAAIHQGLQGELIALQKKAYTNFLEHVDVPSGSNQDLTLFQKLYEWSAYVELFNIQTRAFEDVEILEHMVKKFKVKRVIKFLHWLESFPPSKERASSLLEVITMKKSEDAEKIKQLCLTWEVGPDEIYELMPIAAMGRLTGEVKKKAAWSSVKVELSSWLKYVLDFNMSYPEKYFDSKSVVTWLLNRRGVDETTAIFEQFLESRPIIYGWEKQLVASHPATLSRMLPRWLKADVKPRDVLRILPRAVEIRAHGVGGSTKWPGIHLELKLWIGYCKGWNRKHSIALAGKDDAHLRSEEIVLDTLEFCSGAEEVNAFLHGLRADNELKDLASKMEKLLPARRNKLMKIMLLVEANAGHWEVFRKMPIAMVDRSIATFDRAGRAKQIEDPEVFFKKLKQFLGYVDAYRENHGEFSDDEVLRALENERSKAELSAYFQLFGSIPGMEMRAAQLLEALRDRVGLDVSGSLQKETREIIQQIRFYYL